MGIVRRARRAAPWGAMVWMLTLGLAPAGLAASFVADSTADAVDATPGDGVCAAADGACTLRAAVLEANALPGRDEIILPAGVYVLSIPGSGEDLSATGDLDVTGDLALTGAGSPWTILDGGGLDRVLHVVADVDVALSGFTVRHGDLPGNDTGGGIFNVGTIAVNAVVVHDNRAWIGGGFTNFGTATLRDTTVRGNTAQGNGGLGAGGVGNVGAVTLIDSEVVDNTVEAGTAGAIGSFGEVILERTTIRGNSAVDGAGIGIGGGTLVVRDSTVTGNHATQRGGGIGATGGAIEIENSTISANTAVTHAGGINVSGADNGTGGTLTIRNSTVSGNTAGGNGGGILASRAVVFLNNATVAHNVADADGDGSGDGGGLFEGPASAFTASNTIVAANADSGGESPDCSAQLGSLGHNLIESTAGCEIRGDTTGNVIGQDPRLSALEHLGGHTQVHRLLEDSPAIDAAHVAAPGSSLGACEPTDQRGAGRPDDGDGDGQARCDIGAFELPEPCGLALQLAGALTVAALARRRA